MFQKKEKFTILLADDDYLNHVFYNEILPEDKFEIIYFDNGRDAVIECRDNSNIDLVLMDMRMPQIDGMRAIRKIRQFNSELPILIQSAYISQDDFNQISSMHNIDFIDKPVREELLLSKMHKLLKLQYNI